MGSFHTLDVYHHAVDQLRDLTRISAEVHFGDLGNQLRRAGISVVSNIAEGAGCGTDPAFVRFLRIARASNDEIAAQLEIVGAITGQDVSALLATNASTGRMLTALIRRLRSGG